MNDGVPDLWPNDRYATFGAWADAVDRETLGRMTLGAAVKWLRGPYFACACCGPPGCCVDRSKYARQVQRAAHVVVKQISALADRRGSLASDPSWDVATARDTPRPRAVSSLHTQRQA